MRRVAVTRTRLAAVVAGLAVGVAGTVAVSSPASAKERELAGTELRLADGSRAGSVVFFGVNDHVTRVKINVDLPDDDPQPGFHGIHVHANNDPGNGSGCEAEPDEPEAAFASADGHLAEEGQTHGGHAGDLPPIMLLQNGRGYSVSITDRVLVTDLMGRAVILHEDPDNLGNVPTDGGPADYTPNSAEATTTTAGTGKAGNRIACGVVAAG